MGLLLVYHYIGSKAEVPVPNYILFTVIMMLFATAAVYYRALKSIKPAIPDDLKKIE